MLLQEINICLVLSSSSSKFAQNKLLLGQKPQTKITRTLCPSDNSLSFDLWRTKSRTSSQDITTIHTPKERPDLVLQSLVNKFVKIKSK